MGYDFCTVFFFRDGRSVFYDYINAESYESDADIVSRLVGRLKKKDIVVQYDDVKVERKAM